MSEQSLLILDEPEPASRAEEAYRRLVCKITRLELAPGAVLSEKALMSDLGIGRTPIREALQRLAIEGLVTHMPNRVMLVSDISAATVQQIYEFRSLVEGFSARLAAERASKADIRELAALDAALAGATEEADVDRFVAIDRRFHRVLARASRNLYLEEVVPRIFNLHLRLWFFISDKAGSWKVAAHAHDDMTRGLVDAIAAHDADAAERIMKRYVTRRHHEIKDLLL